MSSSRMTEQIGRVLGGRYRLRAPIGRGASAQVYVADDVRLRRPVAIKVLHDGLADDQAFLHRFRTEAQAAAALNHPHVMAVYDWGEDDDGTPWIVSEYLGGGSLRGLLDRGHRLSPSQALVVGLQAARGLDYAHRRGFVHRDIKPANLLFDDEGRLRIADFGLARALAEAAWTEPVGAVVGTARYASPEQAQGLPLTGRADVYALALVLVEAVTGEVPFAADTTLGTLMARVGKPLTAPEAMGPLAEAVTAAGTAEPEGRADARALAAALAAVTPELPRPAPLPLAGAVDDDLGEDRDPTVLVGGSPAPSTAPASASASPSADDLEIPAFVTGAVVATGPAPAAPGAGARPPGAAALAAGRPEVGPDDHTVVGAPGAPSAGGPAETRAVPVPDGGEEWEPDDLDDPDDEPWDPRNPTGRPRRRWPVMVLFVVLLAGVGVAAGLLIADLAEGRPTHAVPPVVGLTEAQARAALVDLGFEVVVEPVRRDGTVAGELVGTRPATGVVVAEGETVTLLVSEGPPIVDLPAIEPGMSREEAENLLRFSGLVPVVTTRFDEEAPAATVIEVLGDPPAELEKGSEVRLVVSDGPEPRIIPDDLVGAPESDVVTALEGLDLVPVVSRSFSDEVEEGRVISVEPGSGEEAARGDEVEVVVSRGPDLVTVPDVAGASLDEAIALLEEAGLVAGDVRGPARGSPAATSPEAGEQVRRGSEVDIILRAPGR